MEIDYLIRNQIRNITVVDDIFELIKCQINLKIFESNSYDEKYEKLSRLKNELQLKINLYKDLFSQEREESLVKLCCKYFELFFAVLNFERIRPNKIVTKTIGDLSMTKPKVLDIQLLAGEDYEINTEANFENIPCRITDDIKAETDNKENEVRPNKCLIPCGEDPSHHAFNASTNLKEGVTESITKIVGDMNEICNEHNKNKNVEIFEILFDNVEKWICADCTCLNTFYKGHCEVCAENRDEVGVWICVHCSLLNTKPFDCCSNCLTVNSNFKEGIPIENSKPDQVNNVSSPLYVSQNEQKENIEEEGWTCHFTKCRKVNSMKDMFCQDCLLHRNPPQSDCDLRLKKTENGTLEVWICHHCGMFNNKDEMKCKDLNCEEFRSKSYQPNIESAAQTKTKPKPDEFWSCEKCGFRNMIKNEKCALCLAKKLDVIFVPNSWRCLNDNCKKFNDLNLHFCQFCKVCKPTILKQEHVTKYKDKNKIKEAWVCRSCHKFNKISDIKCKGKMCNNSQFLKDKKL